MKKKNNSKIKHLTLLHSNDLHGDFMAEELDKELVGGVAMLSGYINKTRKECPNTLYLIAGDMFKGSLIDTEFQGISTIEIMNALEPDVVSLGNHEIDYGIAHLLFLERCCRFPIVNSNIYIKTNGMRLFNSHKILEVGGMKILIIGIVTEEIMGRAKKDALLGTFVDVKGAADEIATICNSYKGADIDFTILMTHIGFENDIELAKSLSPELGVDIIVGGHSHTFLEKPEKVNDILIVQAGVGTDQIGRFEIDVNTETNSVESYTWQTIPIDDKHCEKNLAMEELILNYKKITDEKYGAILTVLPEMLTHPNRYEETTVGNLFSDILMESYNLDVVLVGSGSLRDKKFGPIVTVGGLLDMYSYPERLLKIKLTGAELKSGIEHALRLVDDNGEGHSEYYQLSKGLRFVFSRSKDCLIEASYNDEPINDDDEFSVGIEGYHLDNIKDNLGLEEEAILERFSPKTVTGNIRTAIEEQLRGSNHFFASLEGRTKIVD